MPRLTSRAEFEEWRQSVLASWEPSKPCITVCGGTGCRALGAKEVTAALGRELKKQGLQDKVDLKMTGCHGFCERGPLVVVYPQQIFYQGVTAEDVPDIVSETLVKGNPVERKLYVDPVTGQPVVHEPDVPFYREQKRVLMKYNGLIIPTKIEDYIAIGGYQALCKALFEMTPEQVIEEIKRSGLRGRGGAGFPTGRKWEECRRADGDVKYVICNADEGDPGAYQDRSLVEGNPHSILEGIIIGAYAVGAHEGFIYIRHEYPLAVENITRAIEQAEAYGLLGKNILGSGFDFTFKVHRGAGAFVCGESSALMRSIEGYAGEPRAKRIHATEKGLWDRPTVLNNVKTWASVPYIINNGADWFAQMGTATSKGTMVFSLVGKVNNTGLVEVPMGATLRHLVFDIGGGISSGKKCKAVQTGGPSGGCIPERLLDLPVDYEALTEAGSIMGSGGLIVMDEDTCMVDVARYFLHFTMEESCGKCTACREGSRRMYEILERIVHGKGQEGDVERLQEIGEAMIAGSLCALGRMAPNPVLSTIRYFRDEYEAHIRDKRCPAAVCKDLITFSVIAENCTGCGVCLRNCPQGAITGEKKQVHHIDPNKCIRCGICREVCRFNAIKVE
ncbi:MAG: NADH-quinone oxidoreductase subunit NuoF [Chloroflexi bacterium]|nr:NADH-quinone oxidoreductase subunit NuoF [Chloroflexota bacterium]